ncbi:SpaA isopeptide-forming pilin-related protein [Enterococcus sp. N342-3-1-2]
MIDYQGSATLLKTDEDNTPLAGAIFKVVDETGATVAENLAKNEEGIVAVDGLAPGPYSFVETQAPTGYQISDEAIKFVIASHAAGQPTEVDAGQLINHLIPNTPNTPNTPEKPSGKLPKTNDTSNRWLALIGGSIVVLTSTAGFYFNKKRKS